MDSELRFGRYRAIAPLGAGGMGEVYDGVDDVLGRPVAIKTLKHRTNLGVGVDERFKNEARAIAALTHPNIVQVFDVDVSATPPYLVMERVAGPSLGERIAGGPLTVAEVCALGVQIAQALAAAHARGILHRDVKPANILATGDGSWKLADFGVAHVPDSSLTMTGQFMGSPAYAAPEALTQGALGVGSDVFGLGASLYQAASGRWPRTEGDSVGVAELLAAVPPVASYAPSLPPALAAVIDRAVDLDVKKRPSAAELAKAIAEGVTLPANPGLAIATPIPTPTPGSSSQRPKRRWILLAVAAAALVGFGVYLGRGDQAAAPPAAEAASPWLAVPSTTTLNIQTPFFHDGKAAKEWSKIVDRIEDGDLRGALQKLDEWERRNGRTVETQTLRDQLVGLGAARE